MNPGNTQRQTMNQTIEKTTMRHFIPFIPRRLAGVLAGCLLVLAGQAGATPRDDTEIYFNTAKPDKNNRPNVLFILDSSTSMLEPVSDVAGSQSRIDALKAAMKVLLENASDVNVGLMRFSSNDGGPVLFPVKSIDADVSTVPSEDKIYTAFITKGENDAREQQTGTGANTVSLAEKRIEDVFAVWETPRAYERKTKTYFVDDPNEDANQHATRGEMTLDGAALNLSASFDIGLQFDNENKSATAGRALRIPPNALIEGAFLEFELDNTTNTSPVSATIHDNIRNANFLGLSAVQANAIFGDRAAPDFSKDKFDVYGRRQSKKVDWNNLTSAATEGAGIYDLNSPDLKELVQNMVSQGCKTRTTALTATAEFSTEGCVFQGDKLGFRLEAQGATGERVIQSHDKPGGMPPKLTVTYQEIQTEGEQALTALRFEGIRIPKGSTVESAHLIFTPAADEKQAMTWTIQAEKTGNSAAPTATARNLSGRTKTSASTTWTLPDWEEDLPVKSPDLKAVVKEVTDQNAWVGGNALTFLISRGANTSSLDYKRKFFSYEGAPERAVRLEYSYTFGSGGAIRGSVSKRVAAREDDAEQRSSSGRGDWNDSTLNFGSNWIGLRFRGVTVPQNATITRAYMQFYSRASRSRGTSYTIRAENSGNAAGYSTARRNITGRSYFSDTVSWGLGSWSRNQWYQSAELKTLVQKQVKHSGWRSGNALAFRIDKRRGGSRSVAAFDRRRGGVRGTQAPRLVIEYSVPGETETKAFKTVRERLEELVDELQPLGATPIQETLTEAARYWRGGAVTHGKRRDPDVWQQFAPNPPAYTANRDLAWSYRGLDRYRQVATISHPGSYCKSETDCGNADTNATGATPTDKYGVYNPADCDPALNPNTPACKAQEIKTSGTLNYLSPFSTTLECQRNFQVLLTDGLSSQGGQANALLGGSAADTARATAKAAVVLTEMKQIMGAGASCETNSNKNLECSPDLAAFMAENDQSSTIANSQTVQTHTIAFALNNTTAQNHLREIANKGKGNFYIANSEEALLSVFEDILGKESASTTVAAPAVPANAFNRLFSRGDIYFGAFAPAPGREGYQSKRWGGNLKKYPLCLDPAPDSATPGCRTDADLGAILDAAGNKAIGGDGEFRASAKNLWHNTRESGAKVTRGGAGGGITDYTARTIYTDIKSSGTTTATASTGASLSGSGFLLNNGNWKDAALKAARDAMCEPDAVTTATPPPKPAPTAAPDSPEVEAYRKYTECVALMEWALGRDVDNEDGDKNADGAEKTDDTRFLFSDVLHARPVVATYDRVVQADGSVKYTDRVLVATNAGGLHFIDGDTGDEKWAFLPNTLLARQVELRANATLSLETGERHGYGLDATPVVRIDDRNNDGRIQAGACPTGSARTDCGDKVHVYLAMRRGGNAIYALDISDPNAAPKFLWRIDGVDNSGPKVSGVGQGNFSRMGQTFSEPALARINTSTGRQTVLIFGGGYDGNLDSDKPAKADGTKQPGRNFGLEAGKPNTGNAIYVVNADTGDLIFWIGHGAGAVTAGPTVTSISASGADIEVPDMFYAIASTVNVFDSNADGLADRLYVGDTAGNVWRVDLGADIVFNGTGTKPEGATVVGRFANLSTAGTLADERRIFYRPAVVQVRDTRFSNAERGEYDYVVVGTGNRANPLATGTNDRLYALRDAQLAVMSDDNNDGVANDYPKTLPTTAGGTSVASTVPLDNGDLVRINADLTTGLTGSVAEKGAEGWYLDLKTAGTRVGAANRPGEKALAPPLVLAGNILFSSYIPVDATDPCSVAVGNGRAYNLGVLTGRAGLNWDKNDPEDGSKTTTDAVKQLQAGGIPPQVVPVYTTDGIKYLVGKEILPEGTPNRPVKTYWYLERE